MQLIYQSSMHAGEDNALSEGNADKSAIGKMRGSLTIRYKDVAVECLARLPRVVDGDEAVVLMLLNMDKTGIAESYAVRGRHLSPTLGRALSAASRENQGNERKK